MATARSGTGSGGKWHLVCLLQVLDEVTMTHQEKKYQTLKAEHESVQKQLKKSMELIAEYTSKIEDWHTAFQSVSADRDFLIECIMNHRKVHNALNQIDDCCTQIAKKWLGTQASDT
jgi:predicted RNA-binding protein with EMAP domain